MLKKVSTFYDFEALNPLSNPKRQNRKISSQLVIGGFFMLQLCKFECTLNYNTKVTFIAFLQCPEAFLHCWTSSLTPKYNHYLSIPECASQKVWYKLSFRDLLMMTLRWMKCNIKPILNIPPWGLIHAYHFIWWCRTYRLWWTMKPNGGLGSCGRRDGVGGALADSWVVHELFFFSN